MKLPGEEMGTAKLKWLMIRYEYHYNRWVSTTLGNAIYTITMIYTPFALVSTAAVPASAATVALFNIVINMAAFLLRSA